jgi:hypothetical protein
MGVTIHYANHGHYANHIALEFAILYFILQSLKVNFLNTFEIVLVHTMIKIL